MVSEIGIFIGKDLFIDRLFCFKDLAVNINIPDVNVGELYLFILVYLCPQTI